MDPDVSDNVLAAAARDGVRVSAWMTTAAREALIYYWQDWHPLDKRDATIPQILAPLTRNDYVNNIDPALDAIKRA